MKQKWRFEKVELKEMSMNVVVLNGEIVGG